MTLGLYPYLKEFTVGIGPGLPGSGALIEAKTSAGMAAVHKAWAQWFAEIDKTVIQKAFRRELAEVNKQFDEYVKKHDRVLRELIEGILQELDRDSGDGKTSHKKPRK